MPSSGRPRHQTDRLELLDEWWRSCERLRDALRMPIGVPPRSWPDKLSLAENAQDSLNRVIAEWSLTRRAPGDTETTDPQDATTPGL
jgi:hypothetical protein